MATQASTNGADFSLADRRPDTKWTKSTGRLAQGYDLFPRLLLAHQQYFLITNTFTLAAVHTALHLKLEPGGLVIFNHAQRMDGTNLRTKTTKSAATRVGHGGQHVGFDPVYFTLLVQHSFPGG